MLDKYNKLNDDAKEYLLSELEKRNINKDLLDRCKKEIDLIYNNGDLFIIKYLYMFKEKNNNVKYHFRGMNSNLLFLYLLSISIVDPIKYNLSYEICKPISCFVEFRSNNFISFLDYLEKEAPFKTVIATIKGAPIADCYYLIIPNDYKCDDITLKLNDSGKLQTVESKDTLEDRYIIIWLRDEYEVKKNKLESYPFKTKLERILKPKDFEDYVKVESICRGTNIWENNQDKLFKKGIINIKNIISNRDDVYDYLLNHGIDKELSIKITNFIRKGKACIDDFQDEWEDYKDILLKNNCEKWFIDVCSKILYLFGRGQIISELLYENNERRTIK